MSVRRTIAVASECHEEVLSNGQADAIGEVLHPQYPWRVGTNGPWSVTAEGVESV